jgi:hypothetical protein
VFFNDSTSTAEVIQQWMRSARIMFVNLKRMQDLPGTINEEGGIIYKLE